MGLHVTEKYPKVPRRLLVKLSSVEDNDCLDLEEAILTAGDEGIYETSSMSLVPKSSFSPRTPSPFSNRPPSPFSSPSQTPFRLSSLGDYSPPSLPSLSDSLRPLTPIEENSDGDLLYMGKRDGALISLEVDIKPDVRLFTILGFQFPVPPNHIY